MARERFTFEGLEPIEDRLRRLAEDVAYLTVTDRTERRGEEALGRFDFGLADALPYLDGPPPELGDDDEDDTPPLFGEEDEEAESEDEPSRDGDVTARDLAEAACRWLRDIAVRNTIGEPYRRFRLRVYGPKGVRVLDTGTFLCRNVEYDLDLPLVAANGNPDAPELRIPTPSFDEVATAGAAKGLKALGDYYAQWGRIVLGSMGQLQGVNNAMLGRLHRQLEQSRDQVDQLVAAILEHRAAEAQRSDERRAEERAGDARTVLAQQALQQLGEAAKAFLTAKGVNPEMADVLGALGQSPELVAALSDPDVRALMNEPANLKALAGMLKHAGVQARAMREAAAANDPQTGAGQAAAS